MENKGKLLGRLRDLSDDDIQLTYNWRNTDRVRNAMFQTGMIEADRHAEWVRNTIENPNRFYFIYEYDGTPIGSVGINWVDKLSGRADWSFYKGAEDAPRRSGLHMMALALKYFYTEMNGRKMSAEVIEDNHGSLYAHERLGFVREAQHRQHVVHNGTIKDVIGFGLLRDEWVDMTGKLVPAISNINDKKVR